MTTAIPRDDRKAEPAAEQVWEVLPAEGRDLQSVARICRKMVKRRAIVAAGVAMVPVPALDWMTGVGLLMDLLPRINAEFGLSNEQIERLAPDRRLVVYKAISTGGGMLVGKIVTRDLVIWMLKLVGVRLTTQQAAKFVPIAGQAVSAALTYGALCYVCEQHIRQCIEVQRLLALPAPALDAAAA